MSAGTIAAQCVYWQHSNIYNYVLGGLGSLEVDRPDAVNSEIVMINSTFQYSVVLVYLQHGCFSNLSNVSVLIKKCQLIDYTIPGLKANCFTNFIVDNLMHVQLFKRHFY